MPVREDGRWESWETRNARVKAESATSDATAQEEPNAVPPAVGTQPRRSRRSRAAAEAAIAEATGTTVAIADTTTEDPSEESAEDNTTEEQEPA